MQSKVRIHPVPLAWKVLFAKVHQFRLTSVEWGARRVKPSHGVHLTGHYPLGPGRGSAVYESGLERDGIAFQLSFPGFEDLVSQPVTIKAVVNDEPIVYTPDQLVTYTVVPRLLEECGYGRVTLIEVKPRRFIHDARVLLKLAVLRLALGLPVVLLSDCDTAVSHRTEARHVH